MPKPTLPCIFRPLEHNGMALVDTDSQLEFDGGSALLSLSPEGLRAVLDRASLPLTREATLLSMEQEVSGLAVKAGLVGDGPGQHKGPFRVILTDLAIREFFRSYGFYGQADLAKLTQDDLTNLRLMHDVKRIRIAYEIYTEQSIDAGEPEETGWENEEGVEFTSFAEAYTFLQPRQVGNLNASASEYSGSVWYTGEVIHDTSFFESGEQKTLSYHLVGFTEREERTLFAKIVGKTDPSLDDLFAADLGIMIPLFAQQVHIAAAAGHIPAYGPDMSDLVKSASGGSVDATLNILDSVIAGYRNTEGKWVIDCRPVLEQLHLLDDLLCSATDVGFELREDKAPAL
jgi:hypothetical protein